MPQQWPNIISYWNYKRFDSQTFKNVISKKIKQTESVDFEAFKRIIIDTMDKHSTLKKKVSKGQSLQFCY